MPQKVNRYPPFGQGDVLPPVMTTVYKKMNMRRRTRTRGRRKMRRRKK